MKKQIEETIIEPTWISPGSFGIYCGLQFIAFYGIPEYVNKRETLSFFLLSLFLVFETGFLRILGCPVNPSVDQACL